MNDQDRGHTSVNGWSSRSESTGIATAEPVDRRWFEEALRAQGFLVEPPALEDDDVWQEPLGLESLSLETQLDDEPLPVETESSAEPEPLADDAEPEPEPEPLAADAEPEPEPEPLAAHADAEPDVQPWDIVPTPERVPSVSSTVWPVIGETPARVAAVPAVAPAPGVVAVATRQAVAPATLSADTPPVPTAALAARLSRGAVTAPVATSPVSVAAIATPGADGSPAVVASDAARPVPASIPPADPWTLPALQADLAAERLGGSTTPAVDDDHGNAAVVSAVTAAAVGATVTPDVVDASSAEVTARAEADLQAQVAPPLDPVAAPAAPAAPEPLAAVPASATVASVGPTIPFAAPTAGIAAVAPRPPGATVGTTVDGGESDLWGLVGDPRKAATPTTDPSVDASASRATTIVLTVIVAFVVVALVLGFLYLLTNLL